jgi:type III pantothenate kinase
MTRCWGQAITPTVVADVGNSRIKWGWFTVGQLVASVSLPPDDPGVWEAQLKDWGLTDALPWAVSGSHPPRCDRLVKWLRQRGDRVEVLYDCRQLPLEARVSEPWKVGLDRLLNAVAVNSRVQREASRIIIDAGTAVTVDWVDEEGAFRGGSIFPGIRLMAKSLNDYTALLPLVEVRGANPELPGTSTLSAIEAGVYWAVAGGIKALVRQLMNQAGGARRPVVFLTGGDASLLAPVMDVGVHFWPHMTLEGIRLSAEALP